MTLSEDKEKDQATNDPLPAVPLGATHPDQPSPTNQTHAWSTKKPRPNDPVFLKQSLGDKVGAAVPLTSVEMHFKASITPCWRCPTLLPCASPTREPGD